MAEAEDVDLFPILTATCGDIYDLFEDAKAGDDLDPKDVKMLILASVAVALVLPLQLPLTIDAPRSFIAEAQEYEENQRQGDCIARQ